MMRSDIEDDYNSLLKGLETPEKSPESPTASPPFTQSPSLFMRSSPLTQPPLSQPRASFYTESQISHDVVNLEDILTHQVVREPEGENFNYVISMPVADFITKFHVQPKEGDFYNRRGQMIKDVIIKIQAVSTILDYYNNGPDNDIRETFTSGREYVGHTVLNYHLNEIDAYERIEEYNQDQLDKHSGGDLIDTPRLMLHGVITDSQNTVKAFFLVLSELEHINVKPSRNYQHLKPQALHQLSFLHKLGIIHANINPYNMCIDEENERVHIYDFGNSYMTADPLDCSDNFEAEQEREMMSRSFLR